MPYKDPDQRRAYHRAYGRKWRQRPGNLEKTREYAREYAARNRDPETARLVRLKSRHGLQPEEWLALYEAQDGRCYMCGEEMAIEDASIEHDHSCCPRNWSCRICRRGLAHASCNSAAGLIGDDPQRLRRIADALEAAQAAVESRKAAMSAQLILDIS